MAVQRRSLSSVLSAIAACAAAVIAPLSPASASTPVLIWSGIKRVNILCNVAGGPGIDHVALTRQLCRDVTRLAAKGAPVPVRAIAIGDPAVLSSDAVTILVHASVYLHKGDRLLAFNLRPYRPSSDQNAVLFGAAPRLAPLNRSGLAGAALDDALTAALAETLPWQARRPGARRVR